MQLKNRTLYPLSLQWRQSVSRLPSSESRYISWVFHEAVPRQQKGYCSTAAYGKAAHYGCVTHAGISHLLEALAFKSTQHRTHFRLVREVRSESPARIFSHYGHTCFGNTYLNLRQLFAATPAAVTLLLSCYWSRQCFCDVDSKRWRCRQR